MSKSKQYAVLGLGRFGQSIVKSLVDSGCSVLACDIKHERVQDISEYATYAVQVDVTDNSAMQSLGLNNFDVVIVAIGANMESSIMATLIAKESGVPYVLAKAKSDMQKTILEKVGADRVVLPEMEMGARIATNLITSNVLDFINLSDEYGIAEIEPLTSWVGISLKKSSLRVDYNLTIIGIKRGGAVIIAPGGDEVIRNTDILIAIGEKKHLQRVTNDKPKDSHKGLGGLFE